jgi:DNA damage-binding protein 1
MAHLYAVTSQKPTAVNFSLICNFTSSFEKNLIIACINHIKIYAIREDGLVNIAELPIFGRIRGLEVYRPSSYDHDLLFVMIEKKKIALLDFDPVRQEVITKARLDVQDRIGRDIESGQRSLIDPEGRVVGLLLYNGFIKVKSSVILFIYNIILLNISLSLSY